LAVLTARANNVRVVIVEGVCGAGKTTLVRNASEVLPSTTRFLTQKVTYGPIAPLEDSNTLDDQTNRRHLLDIVASIRTALESSNLVVVDTLHITQFVRPGILSLESFLEVDEALRQLGASLAILRIGEEQIRMRAVVARQNTGFARYARKFGATEAELARHFSREQAQLIALAVGRSRLPVRLYDGEEPEELLYREFCRDYQLEPTG
jgi:hypothetical protein